MEFIIKNLQYLIYLLVWACFVVQYLLHLKDSRLLKPKVSRIYRCLMTCSIVTFLVLSLVFFNEICGAYTNVFKYFGALGEKAIHSSFIIFLLVAILTMTVWMTSLVLVPMLIIFLPPKYIAGYYNQ